MGLSYKDAGVDIDAGNRAVGSYGKSAKKATRPEVMSGIGGFASMFELSGYKSPVLVSGTDGVGTKLAVAFLTGKHDSIGIDAVAMCVNDIVTCGAEPLFFLDYLAVGKLDEKVAADIVSGIADGCVMAGCALVGGETAEMPGFYKSGEYDVAGFCVGAVEKDKIIDGKTLVSGDKIIGIASNGLHSNGFSLVRKALLEVAGMKVDEFVDSLGCTLGEELMKPTTIYVKSVLPLCKQGRIKAMAHITGGGLPENVPRVMQAGISAVFNKDAWPVPPIFKLIAEKALVEDKEMYRTFNMGIGMVVFAAAEDVQDILAYLHQAGEKAWIIGEVANGDGGVIIE